MLSENFVTGLIQAYPFAKESVAFDIGAHHGKYTEMLLDQGFEHVYAFEPFPENLAVLREKFEGTSKVTIVPKAIHRKTGTEQLFINGSTDQCSISKLYAQTGAWNYNGSNFIEVETITLDDFVADNNIDKIGIMKIDVEGAEQYIFHGATTTLRNLPEATGWIILESHLLVDWEMVTDTFKSLDFKFVNTDLKQVEILEPCNHFLIHKGNINFT